MSKFMHTFVRLYLPLAVVFAASQLSGCSKKEEPLSEEESAMLIQPVAKVELAGSAPAAAGGALRTGEQVVQQICSACHASGAAGAPKIGDKAAWAPRIAQGFDGLVKSATNGKGAMPPKGGGADLSDIEFQRAVAYLANQGGANFKEPEAPAAAAAPAAEGDKSAAADGKGLFESTCSACHSTGAAGAPKVGDATAWKPRIAQGKEALYKSALGGKGAMPPKGGATAPDDQVKAAVDYMVAQVK